ncbi:ATP-binding protein [Bariatricus massiliensis]|uniref:Stage 0 sporulation protein A homolog n=1 Tax=Bariatricus massiliensis TaxID=1745713 RepID=A0ABS8DGX3_9FIRM|nr:ATP-binding protein [Bariatricus massiliensis]MCB7304565.1 response regulator [Bariatricus massiliensis]MCB7375217.1 response regulator [Bariatricus massiliensis]MCB7387676.1 response regulator [Bariatricus massiliensis]MCB7411837.1 response regulator [Bariatricus massiliensis]MCQ5253973.1 ATP-binding protein [Bariatricus massiliensis]
MEMVLIILVIVLTTVAAVLAYRLRVRERQIQEMQRESFEKSNYLTNMSHEIRTPLNGIIGLEYLMRENVDNPERLRLYLGKLRVSSQYLKNLVTDVLDISKIENGQLDIDAMPLDLREVLREVQGMVQIQTEESEITFQMHTELSQPYVVGDSVRLKQILVNLLGNAVKFTDKGGWVHLEVSQIMLPRNNVETCFVITDNGCGMSEEFLGRIWEPFEQEGEEKSRSGNGLGTTLCKNLTEQMGGTISVESVRGEGTRFTVRIPAETAARTESFDRGEVKDIPYTDHEINEEPLVLVADDNEINREIACEILHGKGYRTQEALNGKEAVDMFEESTPGSISRILMDIRMPVMDGYEAARFIRNMDRADAETVKIIALTANAFKEELERAEKAGMDGVITKPVDIEQLLAALR